MVPVKIGANPAELLERDFVALPQETDDEETNNIPK